MLEEIPNLAAEKSAELINGRQIDPGGGLFVEGRDRAAVEAGLSGNIRNTELVSAHQDGEVAADHDLHYCQGDA